MRAVGLALSVLALLATLGAGEGRDAAWAADAPPPASRAPASGAPAPARRPAAVLWDERPAPAGSWSPVGTLHTLVVTVVDEAGLPLPGQRVEWILARAPDAVGDVIAADDAPGKVGNGYAVSVTNAQEQFLDAANAWPWMTASGRRSPDLRIGPGQSWVTITSVAEGPTDVIAYVPGIRDASRQRVVARHVWADFAVRFPEDAVEVLPTAARALTVEVRRASDGAGIAGALVEAEVLDGPEAGFAGGGVSASVSTGEDGTASFTLENRRAAPGASRVRFTAKGVAGAFPCERESVATVAWRRVALECACVASTATATVGDAVDVTVTVRNTGDAPTGAATLALALPDGLVPLEGAAPPLPLGDLAPGAEAHRRLRVRAQAAGRQEVRATVATGPGGAGASAACAVDVVQGALAVTCGCEPASVDVDAPYQLVAVVANEGRGTLRNLRLEVTWADGVTPRTQTTATLAELPAGRRDRFYFEGLPRRPGRLASSVRVTADGVPGASATCEAQVVKCLLEIQLTAPAAVGLGEPGSFTARVANRGDGVARGCVLRIAHGACLGGASKDVPLGDIAPGASAAHDWAATGVANGRCAVVVRAVAPGSEARREADVEVAGLPALASDLAERSLSGGADGIFRVGEEFLYVLEVTNHAGTRDSPPLRAVLRLPPDVAFVSGSTDRGAAVTAAERGAVTGDFVVPVNGRVRVTFRVRAVSTPPGNLVKVDVSVRRSADDAELAFESESTTITERR